MGFAEELHGLLKKYENDSNDIFTKELRADCQSSLSKFNADLQEFQELQVALKNQNGIYKIPDYVFILNDDSTVTVKCTNEPAMELSHATNLDDIIVWSDSNNLTELHFCDACHLPITSGWTDEGGVTHFHDYDEFAADMDQRYGESNWRAEPTGGLEWNYEYRESKSGPWLPESSFYTEYF